MGIPIRDSMLVLVGLLAWASAAEAQLSRVDQRCRDTIAKGFVKAALAADNVSRACHAARNTSGGTTDCNDLSPAQADVDLTFQHAQGNLELKIQIWCVDTGASDSVIEKFLSCPEPCATETAVGNPLADYGEVGDCLACLAREIVETRNAEVMGQPPTVPLSEQDATCHRTIGKAFGKRLKTALVTRWKCQKRQDPTNLDLQPCNTQVFSKNTTATEKANALVAAACGAATLSNIDPCGGATTVGDLQTCLLANDDEAAAQAFTAGYELPSMICPVRIDATARAGTGLAGTSRTFLDVGWTGIAHRMDVPDDYTLSLDVTCPPAAPCGSCTVDGLSSAGPQYDFYTRCLDDLDVTCDQPFGADLDDCAGGECVSLLGPPFPLSAGNTPVCTLNILSQDVTGTLDVDDGASELQIDVISRVHFGVSPTQPCPVCEGDPAPQDGVRAGTCIGGTNHGELCDTQAFDVTFAKESLGRGLSLDCPPQGGMNILPPELVIPLDLTTGSTSLGFDDPCDAPLGFLDCACGVCSLDTTLACKSDAECSIVGAGSCVGGGAGSPRQPNDCHDIVNGCAAVADAPAGSNRGECDDVIGDTLSFCDGVLAQRGNGRGYLLCTDNADCAGHECDPTTPAPDGCGQCTLEQRRECFLGPITATGDPDVERPLLVSTFCVPATSSTAINGTYGLPGPARTGVEMEVDLVY